MSARARPSSPRATRPTPRALPARPRGVALLIAVFALALALLLVAALLDAGEASRARHREHWRAEQAGQLMRGLEGWAASALVDDAARSRTDSLDEPWAQPVPPIEVPGARIRGRLRDLGGCFNVNGLAPGGVTDPQAVARLGRVLQAVGADPRLAPRIADLVDADRSPQAGGAEPGPGLSPDAPLSLVAELRPALRLPEAEFARVASLLCALPADHRSNLNTAPPALWQGIDARISPMLATRLARTAGGTPWADLRAVREALLREGIDVPDLTPYAVDSRYVVAEADIEADGIALAYASLLAREPGRVRVIARVRGRL